MYHYDKIRINVKLYLQWDGKIFKWEYCENYNANDYEPPLLRRSERIAARRRAHVLI